METTASENQLILPNYFTGKVNPECFLLVYSNPNPGNRRQVHLMQNLICIPLSGEKTVNTPTTTTKATAENYFILPSGYVLMTERNVTKATFDSLLIFFSDQYLVDFCLRRNIKRKNAAITEIPLYAKDSFIQHFIASVQAMPPDSATDQLHGIKTEELLHYLNRIHPEIIQQLMGNIRMTEPHRVLQQVVLANQHSNLTLAELAFLSNMSLSTFKRQFTEVFHTSPGRYFRENKISRAKQLLLLNRRPSEIYADLGYENLSSFSQEFKKQTGQTPSAFQAQHELSQTLSDPIG